MQEKIIKVAIELFNENSIKFTLEDVAKKLKISKKTLYNFFESKEDLLKKTVEYVFNDIALQHQAIIKTKLAPIAQLRKILSVYPSTFIVTGDKITKLKEFYPEIYNQILHNFNINWQLTYDMVDLCIEGGFIKHIDKECFKLMLVSIFDGILQEENQKEKLEKCLDYIFEGILNFKTID